MHTSALAKAAEQTQVQSELHTTPHAEKSCASLLEKMYCKAKKRPFEMTFCCAEKAFKLLAQKCDQIWRKNYTTHIPITSDASYPPKRHVRNRDFVDFCAKLSAYVFENSRYKVDL